MTERPTQELTLVYPIDGEAEGMVGARILLGMKKRGFGMNKWNGFGGKIEQGETLLEAAARVAKELLEESGLVAQELVEVAEMTFDIATLNKLLHVRVFLCHKFTGTPQESDEMRPQWFDLQDIPYKLMWGDDAIWLPGVLSGNTARGYFTQANEETITNYSLEAPSPALLHFVPHAL